MTGSAADLLHVDLHTGFFEELDTSSVPWQGRGIYRFQAQERRRIGERVFSREEVDEFTGAAYEAPQQIGIEGDRRRWWAFEGYWYVTHADLSAADVTEGVREHYRAQLAEWDVPTDLERPAAPKGERQGAYLSVCSMFLNGAPYLAEWIEFHLLAGVERFFLYDHQSTDSSREVLAPYVDDGTVVLYDWTPNPGQTQAFQHCSEHHRDESRWIAFMDLDEFLFSATEQPLREVLRAYEPWPGVLVNRPAFGSAGHELRPARLVTESYRLRSNVSRRNRAGKTIADPARLDRCGGAHHWTYTEGYAVDELLRPAPTSRTLSPSFSRLRLNHYPSRSREEFERKLATPRGGTGTLRVGTTFESVNEGLNDITDLAAASHAPAVKEALRRRQKDLAASRPAPRAPATDS